MSSSSFCATLLTFSNFLLIFFLINYDFLNFVSFESLDNLLCLAQYYSPKVTLFSFSFLLLILREAIYLSTLFVVNAHIITLNPLLLLSE